MRIILKFVISFFIILFLFLTYLSLFGIETQRFNKIIKKIKSVNNDLDIKLKTIKVLPTLFNLILMLLLPQN